MISTKCRRPTGSLLAQNSATAIPGFSLGINDERRRPVKSSILCQAEGFPALGPASHVLVARFPAPPRLLHARFPAPPRLLLTRQDPGCCSRLEEAGIKIIPFFLCLCVTLGEIWAGGGGNAGRREMHRICRALMKL
jgi:hypothetical protein